MGYDHDELVTIGARYVTRHLTAWATQVLEAARADLAVLKTRGITDATLKDAREWLVKVNESEVSQEDEKRDLKPLLSRRLDVLERASDWRAEVIETTAALFDSEPDTLAVFRSGVKISGSLPKMKAEFQRLLPEVRRHLQAFRGLGLDDAFVRTGETILREIEEQLAARARETAETKSATEALYHSQGVLYTKVRFILRRARTTLRKNPSRAKLYGYETLKRGEAAAQAVRSRAQKTRAAQASAK